MPLKVGSPVRLISKNPHYGAGGVEFGAIGVLTDLSGVGHGNTDILVDFPDYDNWRGRLKEVEEVSDRAAHKHIRYKASLHRPHLQQVEVQILDQTHRLKLFGKQGQTYFIHDRFSLLSSGACPSDRDDENSVFVRGTYEEYDNRKFYMSLRKYALFKSAVFAYNEYFSGDKEKDGLPHVNSADEIGKPLKFIDRVVATPWATFLRGKR